MSGYRFGPASVRKDSLMANSIPVERLIEASTLAGLFFPCITEELGVSECTWYRWMREGRAPLWALRHVEFLSGDLSRLGWHDWRISAGVLTHTGLAAGKYGVEPGELLRFIVYPDQC